MEEFWLRKLGPPNKFHEVENSSPISVVKPLPDENEWKEQHHAHIEIVAEKSQHDETTGKSIALN